MLATLRDIPADAEIISHQLLIKGGFIRRVTSGIYAYMPLMWRVLKKITSIVEEEMNNKGCLQTLLPQLHPSELWERSGRWQGYTSGEGIMFHLEDRQGKMLGLGPTHEEIVTNIAGEILRSYKQLPVNIYQIQTKFRDEIRPRFGLMRSREFIMKDAYSFHSNEQDLISTYNDMNDAYNKIFKRCGLNTVSVEADSGSIGDAASQEFMVTAESGEDLILKSSDNKYAANQEKAISIPNEAIKLTNEDPKVIKTPGQNSIKDICFKQGVDSSQILKVILLLATLEDGEKQPILITIRGDQDLNEVKLSNVLDQKLGKIVINLRLITNEDLKSECMVNIPFGSIGPDLNDAILDKSSKWNKSFYRIADKTATDLDNFICGANKKDEHRFFYNWSLIGGKPQSVDIRKAKEGDICHHDKNQKLSEYRGIEVGHIFQLGTKYSEALNTTYTNKEGKQEAFWMGCYGIGISRLAQSAVEQNHDKNGIIWPLSISPFEVIIVIANMQDKKQIDLGENIYSSLKKEKIDVLIDDRDERAGVKFKDADLIGIPWRIVVGRDAEKGEVELIERSTQIKKLLAIDSAIKMVKDEVYTKR